MIYYSCIISEQKNRIEESKKDPVHSLIFFAVHHAGPPDHHTDHDVDKQREDSIETYPQIFNQFSTKSPFITLYSEMRFTSRT